MSWRRRAIEVVFNNWHVKILSLIAAILIVYFNNITALEDRVIVVPLEVRISSALLPAAEVPSSVRITLRGEGEDIVNIISEDIRAFVDLGVYDTAGLHSVSVQIERRGSALTIDPLQVISEPAQLSIRLEPQVTREVAVTPDVQGALAGGYVLDQVTVVPLSVIVSGPQNILDQITEVSTQPISVSNHTSSSSTRVDLLNPGPYVTFTGGNSVNVVFAIGEVPVVRSVDNVAVTVVGLRSRFVTEYDVPQSSVTVRGLPSELEQLDTQNVSLVVDVESINTGGQYNLNLIPQTPEQLESIEIVDYQPQSVLLTVSRQ